MGGAARLAEYERKRDFGKTPEPRHGSSRAAGQSFVIQKHFARRLHFDLRLEINGVLVSWAITKGPTLDPAIRRLAVRTEDHPLSYGSFEGAIPEGQYGAGQVEIWDRGSFTPIGDTANTQDIAGALADGHLKFRLHGERLRGGFALVRTKPKEKGGEQWLLIKERDDAATTAFDPVETWVGSVGNGKDAGNRTGKPAFVKPQLATEADRPPSGDVWVHEIKYDGYRLIAVKDGARVRLFTRSGQDWTAKLTGIEAAVAALPRDQLALDGELVVFDADGNADFQALQSELKGGATRTAYVVFDCLQIDQRDLKHQPWAHRNGELKALLADVAAPLKYCDHVAGNGREVFEAAIKLGAEGIVSKHTGRPWRSGRNGHWLKVKGERRATFAVGGYRKSKVRPFASLLLGEPDGSRLIYRGRVGTGFSDKTLSKLATQLGKLQRATSPFAVTPAEAAKDAVWTTPRLYIDVAFVEKTADGHLRHPKFLGIAKSKPTKMVTAPSIKLTHPDRLLYPEAGVTKADLLSYYQAASDQILPHIEGRFVSLLRAPDGKLDKAFFQRHEFPGQPDSIETITNMGRRQRYLVINTPEGLEAAAQFSVLELHPWGAKRETLDYPDRLVMDLDPDDALPFDVVRAAAQLVRDVLQAGALESYPLLTGGKGVHVIAPLNGTDHWDTVSGFAQTLARHLARAQPDLFVASQAKSKRKGRIYLDWQRNRKSATAIAPWSPRARAGAPVACPVTWSELAKTASAAAYDLTSARERLAKLARNPAADYWAGYWECDQSVPEL